METDSIEPQSTATGFATPAEAARFLRLSKAMIHKLIGEGRMPACRYGRAVRIPWSWLYAQAGER
jgi:excisionase family DNA binding protein